MKSVRILLLLVGLLVAMPAVAMVSNQTINFAEALNIIVLSEEASSEGAVMQETKTMVKEEVVGCTVQTNSLGTVMVIIPIACETAKSSTDENMAVETVAPIPAMAKVSWYDLKASHLRLVGDRYLAK